MLPGQDTYTQGLVPPHLHAFVDLVRAGTMMAALQQVIALREKYDIKGYVVRTLSQMSQLKQDNDETRYWFEASHTVAEADSVVQRLRHFDHYEIGVFECQTDSDSAETSPRFAVIICEQKGEKLDNITSIREH